MILGSISGSPEHSAGNEGRLKTFKLALTTVICLSVLATFVVGIFRVAENASSEIPRIALAAVVGLIPTMIYYAKVSRARGVLVCGSVLAITTIPAWLLPIFSLENPFAFGYAFFLVFPLTLILTILFAAAERELTAAPLVAFLLGRADP